MLAPLFLAFLIYASMLWSPCSPYYMYGAQMRQRGKLQWMSRELMIDAEMKIKAVQPYRDQYYKLLQYQLGDMTYEARDFYKKMVKIYLEMDMNVTYGHLNHYENVKSLVQVHRLSVDIENKVVMIQTWQHKRETKSQRHERMQAVLRSGARLESGAEDVPLREVLVRERLARGTAARAPRPPARHLARQRNNKLKWRHVRDVDFARRSISIM